MPVPLFATKLKNEILDDLAAASVTAATAAVAAVQAELDDEVIAAAASAEAAETAQTDAEAARDLAQEWAENPEDTAITGNPSGRSALHYAAKAAADIDAALASVNLEMAKSLYSGNDYRDGGAGWTPSGVDSSTFGATGLVQEEANVGGSFPIARVFKTVSGGVPVVAGHRYAMIEKFKLEADLAVSAVATMTWRSFLLGSTPSLAVAAKTYPVGALGSPVEHLAVTTFIQDTTKSTGNAYFDIASPKDSSNQNLATSTVKITRVYAMCVDLGVAGDPAYDLTDAELSLVFAELGLPYHPYTSVVDRAYFASEATLAQEADHSATSDLAAVATISEALRSPYKDKRILTLGHSLVSQVNWQPKLKTLLDLEGYSVQGTAGGTLQPKPAEDIKGMFSRAAMDTMLSGIANFNDVGAGGISTAGLTSALKLRTAATIFWTGANDSITDSAASPYKKLYVNKEFTESLKTKAVALSVGTYADTTAGLAATTNGQYFSTAGSITGWKKLYLRRDLGPAIAQIIYHYPEPATVVQADRIMTIAEQDEFEARNTSQGANAFLSEPLSGGLSVTYETLWHTMIRNYLDATLFDAVPEHRFFIVREPQAFWNYDGTLDFPQGYYEKNEVHRRVADRWSIPLIDLWAESGINIATRGWFIQVEDAGQLLIHINKKGGRQVASVIADRMRAHPPITFAGNETDGSKLGFPTTAAELSPWAADNVN